MDLNYGAEYEDFRKDVQAFCKEYQGVSFKSDSNVVASTIDGTSAILTLSINGDTNNYLIDIDGDGDVNGHTLIHTHTGSIADVDITQSGVYDNMITLTTSGDNHDIDISQTD